MNVPLILNRRLLIVFFFVALGLGFGPAMALAADSGHEQRNIDQPFDTIKLDGPVGISVVQGTTASVVIDAPAAISSGLTTKVDNGTLTIDSSGLHLLQFVFPSGHHPLVTVTVQNLKRLMVEGSGDVHVSHLTSGDELMVKCRGSGDVDLEQIKVAKLTTDIAGSADVEASGTAPEQSVRIAGSGDYNARGLKGDSVAVSIAGSGDAAVSATRSLAVEIAGSGDVSYWGEPAVSQSVRGSGEVIHKGS